MHALLYKKSILPGTRTLYIKIRIREPSRVHVFETLVSDVSTSHVIFPPFVSFN